MWHPSIPDNVCLSLLFTDYSSEWLKIKNKNQVQVYWIKIWYHWYFLKGNQKRGSEGTSGVILQICVEHWKLLYNKFQCIPWGEQHSFWSVSSGKTIWEKQSVILLFSCMLPKLVLNFLKIPSWDLGSWLAHPDL